MNILSCDSAQDVIKTLSLIYNTKTDKIERVYNGEWPDFVLDDQFASNFTLPYFAYCMAEHIGGRLATLPTTTSFYHRTRYDGCSEWFKDGLLCSKHGALAFLNKIKHQLPSDNFESIVNVCKRNIKERTSGEGGTQKGGGGPYAFDILDDAKYGNGENYNTPEMFIGPIWGTLNSCDFSSTIIIEMLEKNYSQ